VNCPHADLEIVQANHAEGALVTSVKVRCVACRKVWVARWPLAASGGHEA